MAREDARMDALGVDTIGITHRGKRYFANQCQRAQPALRHMLFSPAMAEICRATLGDDVYFFFDQFVVKGPEGGMSFGWHQDSGYVVGNGGPFALAGGGSPVESLTVNVNNAGSSINFISGYTVAALNIGSGTTATVASSPTHNVLVTSALSILGTGKLNMTNGEMIVHSSAANRASDLHAHP